MPTPTGTISLNDVNIELGRSSGANINMNDSAVRTLAGVGGSGTVISMNDLRGKSSLTVNYPDSATGSFFGSVLVLLAANISKRWNCHKQLYCSKTYMVYLHLQ
jgi:hypothetical protein